VQSVDLQRPGGGVVASPTKELLTLAIPTVLQMASYTVDQFADTLMLSVVSDDYATAASQGGMLAFFVISFGFGVLMLVNAMTSQAFGAQKHAQCGRIMWQGIWFSLIYTVAVLPALFFSSRVFSAMGHEERLIPLQVDYFVVCNYFLTVKLVALAMGQFLLAIGRPNVVLAAAATGIVANIFVNWLTIYGNWGFPKIGVAGAAWGTNAGVLAELLIVAAFVFGPKIRKAYNTLDWKFDRPQSLELMRTGLPSGLQMSGDVASWTLFFGFVMAYYGTATLAANNYVMQYVKIAFMPAWGFSSAVTAIVGRYVGAQQYDTAMHRATLGLRITMAYMVSLGVLFVALESPLLRVFTQDAETLRVGRVVMYCCAGFMVFDAMFVIYMGALRGVTDTFWPMVVQMSLVWGIVVTGGTAAAAYWTSAGPVVPWLISLFYAMVLGFYLRHRFTSRKWMKAEDRGFEVDVRELPAASGVDVLQPRGQ
jgi:multidrug resistance protein, MATE family